MVFSWLDGAIVDFEGFEALVSEKTKCLEGSQGSQSGDIAERLEELAMCSEALLESYLETGTMEEREIQSAIEKRKVFPCYFGSALKLTGVEEFLKGIETFARAREYPEEFGASGNGWIENEYAFEAAADAAVSVSYHIERSGFL